MTISDWLIIFAMIIAPILAIQVQKFIERRNEKRAGKMKIFKSLMKTRASTISLEHVEALNMIDIEFYEEAKVVAAWKLLLDNFSNYPKDPQADDYKTKLNSCAEKSNDLLTDLLYEMAKSLNYAFDKVLLKRGCYIPQGLGDMEMEAHFMRESLVGLFLGKTAIPIKIVENKNVQKVEV